MYQRGPRPEEEEEEEEEEGEENTVRWKRSGAGPYLAAQALTLGPVATVTFPRMLPTDTIDHLRHSLT